MAFMKVSKRREYWMGLSTDDKPTDNLHNGDQAYEVDTRDWYVWYDGEWYLSTLNMLEVTP